MYMYAILGVNVNSLFENNDHPNQRNEYRGICNRPPLISYWEVNFRRPNFHISYWEKISENLPDLQRGDPLQKAFQNSYWAEFWRQNFQNSYWKQIGREVVS